MNANAISCLSTLRNNDGRACVFLWTEDEKTTAFQLPFGTEFLLLYYALQGFLGFQTRGRVTASLSSLNKDCRVPLLPSPVLVVASGIVGCRKVTDNVRSIF